MEFSIKAKIRKENNIIGTISIPKGIDNVNAMAEYCLADKVFTQLIRRSLQRGKELGKELSLMIYKIGQSGRSSQNEINYLKRLGYFSYQDGKLVEIPISGSREAIEMAITC